MTRKLTLKLNKKGDANTPYVRLYIALLGVAFLAPVIGFPATVWEYIGLIWGTTVWQHVFFIITKLSCLCVAGACIYGAFAYQGD